MSTLSTDERLKTQHEYLANTNEEISSLINSLKDETSLKQLIIDSITTKQNNKNRTKNIDEENESLSLKNLSLSQLNQKLEITEQQIYQLKNLNEIYISFKEIENILVNLKLSQSSLLDLHYLNDLFKSIQSKISSVQKLKNSNFIIYKQLTKSIIKYYQQYIEILNNHLKLILPNEFLIENVSLLNDYNSFLTKNDYALESYNTYKSKYDIITDELYKSYDKDVNCGYIIELIEDEDGDSLKMEISNGTSNNKDKSNFILSYYNFIIFINKLNYKPIKNYLNSKISKNLNNLIFKNINNIIENKSAIQQLNDLIKECELYNWKVLFKIEQNESIEAKLKDLHLDWIIDNYINKLRDLIKNTDFSKTNEVENISVSNEDQIEDLSTTTDKKAQSIDENDDGWDESWDDGWDQETQDDDKSKTKESEFNSSTTNDTIQISTLPDSIKDLYEEFSEYSTNYKYLNTSIKAISSNKYPSLKNSFLIYNDFSKLSNDLNDSSFRQFADKMWDQVQIQFYQELKILISSLNFEVEERETLEIEDEDEDPDDVKQLDDFNLNQLSYIYQWFKILFEEKSLKSTNFNKFKTLIIDLIEFCNNLVINTILELNDISEFQCTTISLIINNLNNITLSYLSSIEIGKDQINSFNKLNNINFLLNNHLKDIMNRFYDGELFDLSTNELVKLMTIIFLKSEIRDNYINEIIEFRNMTED
ncbi:DSL1 [Candida pseudojiufengensis]|uniref:DSL1 n=1 Tax=Candida pseudojiufengensis TaxID=497109 RepID=UPI002224E852|nr:DSL1 [Candida pseudojiufengensis]KAI5962589.1 DSL1 [Candida pseudojiufengensis]